MNTPRPPGAGLLQGLAETAKNFVGSFTRPSERLVTIEYPEERQPLPENTRQFPFLVYDGNDKEAGLRCVACQICVEVCPFEAIKMNQEFELATADRFGGLLFHKERLARPNSHFQKLHPTDAAEIDQRRAAEVEKAKQAAAKAAAASKPATTPTTSPEAPNPPPRTPPAAPPM